MSSPVVRIIGLDPGFASFGYCTITAATGRTAGPPACDVLSAGVIRTKKASKKQNRYATDDIVSRAHEIRVGLLDVMRGAHLAAAESLSYPRDASVSAKMGVTFGILASVAAELEIPLIHVSPQALKKHTTGMINATKEEIETVATGCLLSLEEALDALPKTQREHASDAAAIALWALSSQQATGLLALARSIR